MHSALRSLRLFVTGFCMGVADLVPGVSGGTIAFVSGIYEELLKSIRIVTGRVPALLMKGEVREAFRTTPFFFVIPLALGMGAALFSLAHVLQWLLEVFPQQVWGFFFGLVLASTMVVLKDVSAWKARLVAAFLLSAVGAYFLVGMSPVETPFTGWMIFLSGFIAISAMILPGISGSFILLLLGKYRQILEAVVERDVVTLGIFILGCVLGISVAARGVGWCLKRHHDLSIAVLAGFMIGSVRKIWPWQMDAELTLPTELSGGVVIALLCAGVGFAVVYAFDRLKRRSEKR